MEARNALAADQRSRASDTLRGVLAIDGLESRHYLQAWHFLRQLGVMPDGSTAHHLFGVVVEVALAEGLDVLAAYEDHTARYFNYSAAAVVWDHADRSLDAFLAVVADQDTVLALGAESGRAGARGRSAYSTFCPHQNAPARQEAPTTPMCRNIKKLRQPGRRLFGRLAVRP